VALRRDVLSAGGPPSGLPLKRRVKRRKKAKGERWRHLMLPACLALSPAQHAYRQTETTPKSAWRKHGTNRRGVLLLRCSDRRCLLLSRWRRRRRTNAQAFLPLLLLPLAVEKLWRHLPAKATAAWRAPPALAGATARARMSSSALVRECGSGAAGGAAKRRGDWWLPALLLLPYHPLLLPLCLRLLEEEGKNDCCAAKTTAPSRLPLCCAMRQTLSAAAAPLAAAAKRCASLLCRLAARLGARLHRGRRRAPLLPPLPLSASTVACQR